MSEPTLDDYIEVAGRVSKAWEQVLAKVYEEIQPAIERVSRACIHLNDKVYASELMFPKGNEEWDVFV